MSKTENYQDNFLEASQILINAALAQFRTDQTVICTIEDNSDRKNGNYKVKTKEGSIVDATAEEKTYIKKTEVYVLFPADETIPKRINN